ncbi:MAG: hypothetical protein ABWY83_09430 [Actinomycetota bacterium]
MTAARRAAYLIEQAEATLEEASGVIANGYLRLDHYGVRNLPPGRVRCPVCW